MELLGEFTQEDIGLKNSLDKKYRVYRAPRAVVINPQQKVAVIHVKKVDRYELPGGRIEKDEKIEDALKREVAEEAGCKIHNIREIGMTIEYRDDGEHVLISYGFLAETLGETFSPSYTKPEIRDQYTLLWIGLDEAIGIFQSNSNKDYYGKFIQKRELILLEKAKEILCQKI